MVVSSGLPFHESWLAIADVMASLAAKLANVEDRSLSEYCRPVLSLHVFGHAHKLDQVAGPCEGTNGPCQGPRNC